jgi:cation-transporting ATPase 13A3/4/5
MMLFFFIYIFVGFSTAKGELVRSILYPKPVDFKFEKDTYIFVGVLAIIACLGFIYTIILEVLILYYCQLIFIRWMSIFEVFVGTITPRNLGHDEKYM